MVKLSALASELGNEKFGLLFFVGLFLGLWQRYTYIPSDMQGGRGLFLCPCGQRVGSAPYVYESPR